MLQNKPSQDTFDEVQGSFRWMINIMYRKDIEIHANYLSGDEALEKSFMQSTGQSSIWQKRGQKTSIPMTSVIIMKSMVGVGILGIVLFDYNLTLCSIKLWRYFNNFNFNSNDNIQFWNTFFQFIAQIQEFIQKKQLFDNWILYFLTQMDYHSSECYDYVKIQDIFGDTVGNLMNYFTDRTTEEQPFYLTRPIFLSVLGIILLPFLLVKSIEKLRFVSLFAILSISSFSILVIYIFFTIDKTNSQFSWWIPDNFEIKRAFASMPTLILTFNWQFNLFPIYKGMAQPKDQIYSHLQFQDFARDQFYIQQLGCQDTQLMEKKQNQTFYQVLMKRCRGCFIWYFKFILRISYNSYIASHIFGGKNNFIQMIKQFTENKKVNILAKKKLLDSQEQYCQRINSNYFTLRIRSFLYIFQGMRIKSFLIIY